VARLEAAKRAPPSGLPPALGGSGLRVVAQKRPLFPHEAAAGEFDVVRYRPAEISVYECRLPRGVSFDGEVQPHSFAFDCVFGESAGNDDV
jgi:hypothetical protein